MVLGVKPPDRTSVSLNVDSVGGSCGITLCNWLSG